MSEETKTITEAELILTDDERDRNQMRALIDISKMTSNGVPTIVAQMVAAIRYDQELPYMIQMLLINDIHVPCLLIEIMPNKTAVVPILTSEFTIKALDGTDLKTNEHFSALPDKRTMN
jgi:hypothetical protein